MAVILVLASGTAVSLAVTDSDETAVGSNAAVQETTEVGEETTEAADDTDAANVTINDQESDGERVVIEEVTMEEGGFVAIHDETLLDGDALGSVVGTSVYLEAGTHENVIVTLGRPIAETQTLIAMPHQDTNDNEVYDFVISDGDADGPYTADGDAVVDEASVTVTEDQVETTTEVVEETTTEVDEVETTEVDEVETTTEAVDTTEVVDETTTEVDEVETTTEVVEETTTEVDEVETTTEVVEETTTEVVEETTTEADDVETTTEEDDVVETTTEDDVEAPAGQQQFIFKVEQMNIDRWSFVLGDEETPDRTETVSDVNVQDRRVEINLTEMLQNQSEMPSDRVTTQDPEEAQEQLEETLSGDVETVRFVIENVNVENVTFVVTAPEDMELPETPQDVGPEMTTEEDEDEVIETTTEAVEETTTEVDDVETTTEAVETTEVVEETTTEVDDVETTTEEAETTEVVETTTEAEDELESFNVSSLNAPESAEIGDTINVSAVVTNPNDVEATQEVEFRLEGTVIARENVTLNASGSTTMEFQVDTTDVPPGEYVHGVYTRDFGEIAVITLSEPSAGETTTAAETEAQDDEETEVPEEDEETTTVAVETTTEA